MVSTKCENCGEVIENKIMEKELKQFPKKKIIFVVTIIVLVIIGVIILFVTMKKGDKYRLVSVESMEGEVSVLRAEEEPEVFEGMHLIPNDRCSTGENSNLLLLADEDKHILASANTEFNVVTEGNPEKGFIRFNLVSGEALFTIDNSLQAEDNFEVSTSNASICVRGTKFSVEYDKTKNLTILTVYEGRVEVVTTYETRVIDPVVTIYIYDDHIDELCSEQTYDDLVAKLETVREYEMGYMTMMNDLYNKPEKFLESYDYNYEAILEMYDIDFDAMYEENYNIQLEAEELLDSYGIIRQVSSATNNKLDRLLNRWYQIESVEIETIVREEILTLQEAQDAIAVLEPYVNRIDAVLEYVYSDMNFEKRPTNPFSSFMADATDQLVSWGIETNRSKPTYHGYYDFTGDGNKDLIASFVIRDAVGYVTDSGDYIALFITADSDGNLSLVGSVLLYGESEITLVSGPFIEERTGYAQCLACVSSLSGYYHMEAIYADGSHVEKLTEYNHCSWSCGDSQEFSEEYLSNYY